ncbi:iron uptake protein [Sorangium sp. So ce1335]|uniref:iron uptake protein n=1 Tax=Sorangium sp. So ce1335 TaxID=3133335 RepID=UPI003F638EC6
MTTERARTPTALRIVSRTGASLLGSYGFVWGLVTLGTVLGVAAGMPFEEAQTLVVLVAFPVFLACFCWAFTARSVLLVWLVFAAGAAAMSVLGWLTSRAMI